MLRHRIYGVSDQIINPTTQTDERGLGEDANWQAQSNAAKATTSNKYGRIAPHVGTRIGSRGWSLKDEP